MSVAVDIIVSAPLWPDEQALEALADKAVRASVAASGARLARNVELCISFSDDASIRELNAQWRKQDKPTNVLSFPTPGALKTKPMLGDIVIAQETVAREALEQDKTFLDHTTHMIVHGVLHLLGYDHENDADAELMEALERRIAASLGLGDPYEGTSPLQHATQTD